MTYLELITLGDAVGVLHLQVGEALAELGDAELEDLLVARVGEATKVRADLCAKTLEPISNVDWRSIAVRERTWDPRRRR